MINYAKIDSEYDKIYKRLDELEERYGVTPPLLEPKKPSSIAEGLPLHIRCFLIYRASQTPSVKVDSVMDSNEFKYYVSYYDPYELPMIARRISIDFNEMAILWEASDVKGGGLQRPDLGKLIENYLKKEGHLTLPAVRPNDIPEGT
jgi:hypothetical protein